MKDEWLVLAAKEKITSRYEIRVESIAQSVPLGIALLGFLRSPDIEAPAKIPEVAGNKTPNSARKVSKPANSLPFVWGRRFDLKVSRLKPVNSIPLTGSMKAGLNKPDTGMLMIEMTRTTRRALLAFAKMELPARHRQVHTARAAVSKR